MEQHNNQMAEKLKAQEDEKMDLQEKITRLSKLILDSSSVGSSHVFESMMRRNHKPKGPKDELDLVDGSEDLPDELPNPFDVEEITQISLSGDNIPSSMNNESNSKSTVDYSTPEERSLLRKANVILQQKLDVLVHETTRKSQQLLQCTYNFDLIGI